MMAGERACKWFFLFFLTLFTSYCSGTLVGFSYHAGPSTETPSLGGTLPFLEQNKVSPSKIRVFVQDNKVLSDLYNRGFPVDLYLNHSQSEFIRQSKSAAMSWIKTHVISCLPRVNIKSIIAIISSQSNELPTVLSTLKSIYSVLTGFHVDREVKVSVSFSLPFLKNLRKTHEMELQKVVAYIKEIGSYVTVETTIDGESRMNDGFVQSAIERAQLAASLVACKDVPVVLIIKSSTVAAAEDAAEFTHKVSKALENNSKIRGRIAGLYAEVALHTREGFAHRELLQRKFDLKTTLHDTDMPQPTSSFPTTPISTTPVVLSPENPSPTIVTVPSTVTITPTNPTAPEAVPTTTPITIPPTDPANNTPVTNPVTTYPAPSVPVPAVTPPTPVTNNPVPPPATTNAPAVPGASWCVTKSGAPETALQAALDYACGMGGADCSQIQQGASCYNPNTLQNHASYAFNSYYQKNPSPTSCDFGGSATIVNANPSTGSCIFPSSSSSSSPTPTTPSTPATPLTPASPATPLTPATPTPIPTSTTPTPTPTATTPPPTGSGVTGYGTPPTVLNTSNPASGITPDFGSEIPPGYNNSSTTSKSIGLRPFSGCIFLITSFVLRKLVIDV